MCRGETLLRLRLCGARARAVHVCDRARARALGTARLLAAVSPAIAVVQQVSAGGGEEVVVGGQGGSGGFDGGGRGGGGR